MNLFKMFSARKNIKSQCILPSRDPRVRMSSLHQIRIEVEVDGYFHETDIVDVSTKGLGFWVTDSTLDVAIGRNMRMRISFGFIQIELSLVVTHNANLVAGGYIDENQDEYEKLVVNFLSEELTVSKMNEVRNNAVRQRCEGHTRWWSGSDDCELITVESEGEIVGFELTLFNVIFKSGSNMSTFYGGLTDESSRFSRYSGSKKLDSMLSMTPDARDMILKCVRNIGGIDKKSCMYISSKVHEFSMNNPNVA
jgi:hypothetical protein